MDDDDYFYDSDELPKEPLIQWVNLDKMEYVQDTHVGNFDKAPYVANFHVDSKYSQSQSLLLNLPNEILLQIVGQIESNIDRVCLAITCQDLWNLCYYPYVDSFLKGTSWSGGRIMLITCPYDLKTLEYKLKFESNGIDFKYRPIPDYDFMTSRICSCQDMNDRYLLGSLASLAECNEISPLELCILRNLTKRVYVTKKVFEIMNEYGGSYSNFTLVIASLVFYDCKAPSRLSLWAGDSIDIISQIHFDIEMKENKMQNWQDCTAQVSVYWRSFMLSHGH